MSSWLSGGRTRWTRSMAASWRTPLGDPSGSRSIRPPTGSGVAGPIPASSSARLLTQAL